MKKQFIFAIILVLVSALFIILFLWIGFNFSPNHNNQSEISEDLPENLNSSQIQQIQEKCQELGCYNNELYVGSKNSDKYYYCTCHYASRINSENIICFSSAAEAESKNYIYIEC
ncbi:hypothetical protein K9L16_02690 [Candidatus Pacearchaeota archaeon]|nr:hypothetical protein [Candidatus Pacearchaeota archaeon]